MWLLGLNPLTSSSNCYNISSSDINSNCNFDQLPSTRQYILRWPVINPISFLMNDIRSKSFYRAGKATSAASASATAKSTAKSFDKSQNNNPRTYNNSGKSNKVFLHYIPRDPRLRIFNKTATLNKPLNRTTLSELNITEDLCNYGELIGGSAKVNLVPVKS
ncbi:uncharacterized protein [Drosophila kikkawai]|uniref:Uncharacterized protein LOC108076336 n=1 Tax=Drosophila kikkawai TaxID=30033 RepID=A0A6P4IP64_DROKI|nr:uncharacterized protein LOC108076336 [Drosophila kikkawai]XP_017024611.1 uncharacterized protein LOC108076336 [Drosophila kikkawai]XP_017024612.1 uncharacterized protein LOC108076336 [Drosophila kikkawai]